MTALNVSEPDGMLYIVADSHLDDQNASAEEFVEMLTKLENPHTVVFLGDLFKIWLRTSKILDGFTPSSDIWIWVFEKKR